MHIRKLSLVSFSRVPRARKANIFTHHLLPSDRVTRIIVVPSLSEGRVSRACDAGFSDDPGPVPVGFHGVGPRRSCGWAAS